MTQPTSNPQSKAPDSGWTLNKGISNYNKMLEFPASRWTMGRADAFVRTLLGAIFSVAQTAKFLVKSALFFTIVGPLMGEKVELLQNDLHNLTKTAKKTGQAFVEIFAAPNPGYDSFARDTYNNLSMLVLGENPNITERRDTEKKLDAMVMNPEFTERMKRSTYNKLKTMEQNNTFVNEIFNKNPQAIQRFKNTLATSLDNAYKDWQAAHKASSTTTDKDRRYTESKLRTAYEQSKSAALVDAHKVLAEKVMKSYGERADSGTVDQLVVLKLRALSNSPEYTFNQP